MAIECLHCRNSCGNNWQVTTSVVYDFGRVCLSACLSVRKPWRRKFVFAHPVYSKEHTPVKFVYDGHRVKVKVTGAKKYPVLLLPIVACIQLGLSAKSRQASYLAKSNAATNYRGRNDEPGVRRFESWCSLSFKFGAKAAKHRSRIRYLSEKKSRSLTNFAKLKKFVKFVHVRVGNKPTTTTKELDAIYFFMLGLIKI